MSIFSRMADIINSNLTAMLDKAEDPQKMLRLIIQEMEETLVEVRSSSARVIADRKTAQRRVLQLQEQGDSWGAKARLAISKGREDLARAALAEQQQLADDAAAAEQELAALDEHMEHLEVEIEQLQAKLNDARARQKAMLLRVKTVNDRMRVKRQMHRETLDEASVKFEKFERRVDHLEGQLEAMDLGREGQPDLAAEIEGLENDERIEAELARLKAELAEQGSADR